MESQEDPPITRFREEYAFLSNFWTCRVEFEGIVFPGVEQAFQAAKTTDPQQRRRFVELTPGAAKRLGRKVALRADWQQIKVEIMRQCLRSKFTDPELREKLLATGNRLLVEGNRWGDTFWGISKGKGENMLGVLLMELRDAICNEVA